MKDYKVLQEKYPDLLESIGCFECDIGWYDLLDDLLHNIKTKDPDIKVAQIKEKFGTLRFYVWSATDEIFDMINTAEQRSGCVCERCGIEDETVKTRNGGWIYTLCDKCEKGD